MCPRRVASRSVRRESIQELMLRARLLDQEALREVDAVRRSALEKETGALWSEARRRLRPCVVPRCMSG